MDLLQTILLALIQGVSEFLPISSSAHLILPAQLLNWPDQGLLFDVAVHVGSLAAVVFYFRHDLSSMARAWVASQRPSYRAVQSEEARLVWMLAIATLPAIIAGLAGKDFIAQHLRSTVVIATTTILFGLLLGLAELRSRMRAERISINYPIALFIGCAQVLSLIPGTSRSGITITAAVLLGMSKSEGARFSFLLSIPIIFAAGLLLTLDLFESSFVFDWSQLLLAVLVSGLSAWCCILLFLRLIERIGLMPFVWYRLALGAVLIYLITQGEIHNSLL